eukprot:gene7204-7418_t
MAILQLIPGLSPTSWFTTVAPLVFVLAVNAIKEGYDDVHRHRNDNQINNRHVLLLSQDREEHEIYWKDVVAGDLIKVRAGEEIPADLDYQQLVDSCTVGCEAPNPRLYSFEGFVEVHGPRGTVKEPLDINNLMLRGSVLRKTDWIVGLAINVGADSKIVQNMTKAPRKVTQLERAMNGLVFVQFSMLIVFCAVLAGLDHYWAVNISPTSRNWYLKSVNAYPELPPGGPAWAVAFLRFIILLSNMIPISLYVSLEVVKVFQCALLLNQDRRMYHKDTDTPFVCRTTTLNEELGQVQYVLSDKTGTLTQNVMGFVWASIGGKLYGKSANPDNAPKGVPADTPHTIALDSDMHKAAGIRADGKEGKGVDADVDRFLLNLAVCNTVVPSKADDGSLQYQASSPDEEALVQGAAYLGYRLVSRTTDAVEVEVRGKPIRFDILALLEFNSDRKRMSIIVRHPETGKLIMMTKGADSMILARLAANEPGRQQVEAHLDEMAHNGYRTLTIAQQDLSVQEFTNWQARYEEAQNDLGNRDRRMAEEQEKIEVDLHLVGATAVEDKLQDGVPECLQALAAAGIKVWVLTGDKVETAISIAFSCRLFMDGMGLVEFREADFKQAEDLDAQKQVLQAKLEEVRRDNRERHVQPPHTNCGIVIEGGALHVALDPELQDDLMALCKECKAVVCCRVSPMQKAQVTGMVKKKAGAITLGIGDGANDVGMIRAAHIGVGISGREGRAAVLSSDFSFAQFRYLQRLLLLHGRWSYLRNKEVVLYSFYKNWAYVLVYVYLQFVAGFSAVPVFTTMMISTFNMIFTACPIVAYAVLEQDLKVQTVLEHPETYEVTRTATRAKFFWEFVLYTYIVGTWHSLPVYFLPWYTLTTPDRNALAQDLAGTGTAVFIALVFAVALKLCLRTHCWSWITHLVYWLSLAVLFPFVYVISILWPSTSISGVADMSGVGYSLFSSAVFWLATLVGAPAIALLPDIAVMLFRRYLRPDVVTLLQEKEVLDAVQAKATKSRDSQTKAANQADQPSGKQEQQSNPQGPTDSSAGQPTAADGVNGAPAGQLSEADSPIVSPKHIEGDEKQVYSYDSTEKPFRSAMRPSMDARSETSSRRSTRVSNVGFAVGSDAPDAGRHKDFAGADSISLKKIVDTFYDKVLSDPQLNGFFKDIDMLKLKRHQVRFMGLAFGGKELVFEEDPNLNLRKVHYRLIKDKGLGLEHWEMFLNHFQETLDELGEALPQQTREMAMRSIRTTKHYFVPIGQETEYTNASIAALPEDPGLQI